MSYKISAAPISWGVCEVSGWGHQMDPARVLTEMKELGFIATEFGPEGFLPNNPSEKSQVLEKYGMKAIAGFVPVVLHDAEDDPISTIERELEGFVAAGADIMVLAAATGINGYDSPRPVLNPEQWQTMYTNLKRIEAAAAAVGISIALHPHAGTMVEQEEDLKKILENTSISICFDTGHMFIGGIDPVKFATHYADRVSHVHLKDVRLDLARKVRSGEITYYEGVVSGMYTPLGQGDIDIASIIKSLKLSGYQGWFVLEQDKVVDADPAPGKGPLFDAQLSLEFLQKCLRD
ncbi:TIM barrel protein [Rothia nasisuis]|uniref:TIM barrel protein n=1 Tax=Rothia nasisuis TaxID=2109647 RepID=UPI001F1B466A|nr:TIM barrel protein [Rothia nasisuis]